MDRSDKLPSAKPDEFPAPLSGEWGRQKHLRAWLFAQIFATGMRKRFPTRVYLDLFSSAGKWRNKNKPGEWNLGSALLALNVDVPFSHYIFCDALPENMNALRARVEREHPEANARYFVGRAEDLVDEIIVALPRGERLTFCLVDPWDLSLDFSLVRELARRASPVDFLVLIADKMDAQRNQSNYEAPRNKKVERFLSDPDWRPKWKEAEDTGTSFAQFIVRQFTERMVEMGYLQPQPTDIYTVRRSQGGPIYVLAFYSRNELGYKFWRQALKYAPEQVTIFDELGFGGD